jgi:hypothetical protein
VECPFREISFRELSAGVVGVVEADVGLDLDDERHAVRRLGHLFRQVDPHDPLVGVFVLQHLAEDSGVDAE